jgi:SAM-dependent methyltransferase
MNLLHLLRQIKQDRWLFTIMYWRGKPPWDTGISPPELVEAVEGVQALPPGRALDLGCGTGTNSLYLAQHGWQVTGVDFAAPAIELAQRKASAASTMTGSVRFIRGDVSKLERLGIDGPCSLVLDLGCLHGITLEGRSGYAAGVARLTQPGALFLLYAFGPRVIGNRHLGLTEDEVKALFAPHFAVERIERGSDRGGISSAWYWLRRNPN